MKTSTMKKANTMKISFASLFLSFVLLLTSNNALSQAASATWALTSNGNAAIVGNVTAGAVSTGVGYKPGGISAMSFGTNGVSSTNWIGYSYTTFSITSPYYNQDYYQYTVSPTAGTNFTVNTISLQASASTSTPSWFVYYSLDNFATSTQLGTVSNTNFTGLNVLVPDGGTLTLRVFGMDLVSTATAFRNKSVVINGTSSSACTTPAQPSSISGLATVCSGVNQTYTVLNDPGATSYTWTLPGGWTGTSTTNSINTTVGASAGNITVTANNACGSSTVRTLSTTVNSVPSQPVVITGSSAICASTSQTYSVASDPNAINYSWTLPNGWSGFSSTNSITTTTGANGGNITVTANNTCGSSTAQTLSATVSTTPAQPSSISGTASVCPATNQTYSVTNNPSATSYNWTLPGGWSGTSTTNSIDATVGSTGGNITVTASNACGTSTAQTLSTSVTSIDNTVSVNGAVITANQNGAGYQWVDCDNSNEPVLGATSQSFTPAINGNYAVEITLNGCTSTSSCNAINSVGVEENDLTILHLYPNPTNGIFTISIEEASDVMDMNVFNISGQLLVQKTITGTETVVDLSNQANGIYFVNINKQTIKLVKQ